MSVVLDALREGRTQRDAFKQAAERLNRTPGACALRWNGRLRKTYCQEIENARRDGQKRTVSTAKQPTPAVPVNSSIAIKETLEFLQRFDRAYQGLRDRAQALVGQRDRLRARVDELEQQVKAQASTDILLSPEPDQLQQDAQLVTQIAVRAWKILDRK